MIVYLNGDFIDASDARLSLFDGGYMFGDGLFETLRLYGGRPHDLRGHMKRLRNQLSLLNYSWRPDEEVVAGIIHDLVVRNSMEQCDCRARLTVSRGFDPENPLPISGLDEIEATVSAFLAPISARLGQWQENGISVQIMKAAFARGNFPQLKSLNYLPTIMALRFAAEHGSQEALLIDRRGMILEGATSNVFIVRQNRLITPPVRLGLLSGRTRDRILKIADTLKIVCGEEAFDRRELLMADEVFMTGSVKEVLPVVRIDRTDIGDGRPGPITRMLQKQYRQDVLSALAAENHGTEAD